MFSKHLHQDDERFFFGRFGEAGAQNVNFLLFTTDLARDVEIVVSDVLPQLAGRSSMAGV